MPQTATPDATCGLNQAKNSQTSVEFFNEIGKIRKFRSIRQQAARGQSS
jgi:hypothetical protein